MLRIKRCLKKKKIKKLLSLSQFYAPKFIDDRNSINKIEALTIA